VPGREQHVQLHAGQLQRLATGDRVVGLVALERSEARPRHVVHDVGQHLALELGAVHGRTRGPRDWRGPLAGLAARHHVIAIEIDDPRESDLPDVGELTLVDAETGREVKVDTSSSHLRERFASAAAEERASVATDLRRLGVDHIVLSTAGDWLRTLAGELRLRGIRS
jgi:uncharacterized protein (DUF58 family)